MTWIHLGHQGKSLSKVHLKMSQNATERPFSSPGTAYLCAKVVKRLVPLRKRGKASMGETWKKGKVAWRCQQQSPDCAGPSRSW